MDIQIGAFDSNTRTVSATFTQGNEFFTRAVNAVLDAGGAYDEAATAERVAEVGRGVAYKLAAGLITFQPEPAPQDKSDEDTAPASTAPASAEAASEAPASEAPATSAN